MDVNKLMREGRQTNFSSFVDKNQRIYFQFTKIKFKKKTKQKTKTKTKKKKRKAIKKFMSTIILY